MPNPQLIIQNAIKDYNSAVAHNVKQSAKVDMSNPHRVNTLTIKEQRDYWRTEHDRILREYQHRLMTVATFAIESIDYPENDSQLTL